MKDHNQSQTVSISAPGAGAPRPNGGQRYISVDFEDLQRRASDLENVPRVLAWLYCGRYDVLDVAERLTRAGYEGRLTAVCRPLPKKAVVEREMKRNFPRIVFDVEMDENAGSANPYEATLRSDPGLRAIETPPLHA